jgi:HAE1 family hydrophobic/amphiphilic exporter-1
MDHDGSAVAISDAVKDKLPGMRKDLGSGSTAGVPRRSRPSRPATTRAR